MGDLFETIDPDSLSELKCIGRGGFGSVFKAHHKHLGIDVAIKTLRCDPGETMLWREARYLDKAASHYVVRLLGIYRGSTLPGATTIQTGIVMDFMERGSLQSLLTTLAGPPPWPLAFRIAHQIALGMNYLHSREIMHHDLHLNNVLLDEKLNAKLADFGLSRVPSSVPVTGSGTNGCTEEWNYAGFYKYKPPEAFSRPYKPSRAYDRYSYGILLWSILTGKEAYPDCSYGFVAVRIPDGDRPCTEDIDVSEAEGLAEMVELMKNLWAEDPKTRNTFKVCCGVTGHVFSLHSSQLEADKKRVLSLLDSRSNGSATAGHSQSRDMLGPVRATQATLTSVQRGPTPMDFWPTGRGQDMRPSPSHITSPHVLAQCVVRPRDPDQSRMSNSDKARFVENNKDELIQSVTVVMAVTDQMKSLVPPEVYRKIFDEKFSEGKMRVLYLEVINKGSDRLKAAFYDAIEKHQFDAIEKVGGN